MYADLILLVIFYTIFNLLFNIDQILYNPFGPRELDVPHDIVGAGLRRLATRLGGSKMCFPDEGSGGVPSEHVVEMESEYDNIEVWCEQEKGRTRKGAAAL